MKFTNMQTTVDDDGNDGRTWYADLSVNIEDNRDEVLYAHRVLAFDSSVSVIPNALFQFMMEHRKEFVEMIAEKYPEQAMKNEYSQIIEFLKQTDDLF